MFASRVGAILNYVKAIVALAKSGVIIRMRYMQRHIRPTNDARLRGLAVAFLATGRTGEVLQLEVVKPPRLLHVWGCVGVGIAGASQAG